MQMNLHVKHVILGENVRGATGTKKKKVFVQLMISCLTTGLCAQIGGCDFSCNKAYFSSLTTPSNDAELEIQHT